MNEVGKLYDAVLWYATLPPPASVSVNRARLTVFSCVANTSTAPAGFRHAATPYAVLDLTGLAAPNRSGTPVAVTSVTGGFRAPLTAKMWSLSVLRSVTTARSRAGPGPSVTPCTRSTLL